jgi:hypothetical protein
MSEIQLMRGWYKGTFINFVYRPCVYSKKSWIDIIQGFSPFDDDKEIQTENSCVKLLTKLRVNMFIKFKKRYVTLRQLQKHWKDSYLENIYGWFSSINYLLKNGYLLNDDKNGWEWLSTDMINESIANKSYIVEPPIYDFCVCCEKETRKRCSGCLEEYYCCEEHQLKDWKTHKVFCKLTQLKKLITKRTQLAAQITNIYDNYLIETSKLDEPETNSVTIQQQKKVDDIFNQIKILNIQFKELSMSIEGLKKYLKKSNIL